MKKFLAIISTDKHLSNKNIEEFKDFCDQEIELAKKYAVDKIIWLGDIFDSRVAQREEVLNTLNWAILQYAERGLNIICIPGNHDKTNYSSSDSFLKPYSGHKNFILFENASILEIGDFDVHLIPFFDNDTWLRQFDSLNKNSNNDKILFSHIAVNGSTNNDGSVVESKITPALLKDYFKVFLGHYHNQQKIGKNIFHLPSTIQNNFGEDNQKGFILLDSDGGHLLVKSKFKEFKKIVIDADGYTDDDLICLIRNNEESCNNIRFELNGSPNRLKSIKKQIFKDGTIDLRIKYVDPEENEVMETGALTPSLIYEKFDLFCKNNNLVKSKGLKYLEKVCQI